MTESGDLSQARVDRAPQTELALQFSGKTLPSIGHPERNEDAIGYSGPNGVAMVLDGVGGLARGDQASRTAIEVVNARLRDIPNDADAEIVKEAVSSALVEASERVRDEVPGGGSTAVVAKFIGAGGEKSVVIGSIGDSRASILRDGHLLQITEDDGLVSVANLTLDQKRSLGKKLDQVATNEDFARLSPEEQAYFRRREVITGMLGDEHPAPHIYHVVLRAGDVITLTSDGVHDNLTSGEIERTINTPQPDIASALVDAARARSQQGNQHLRAKPDDISAVVIKVSGVERGFSQEGGGIDEAGRRMDEALASGESSSIVLLKNQIRDKWNGLSDSSRRRVRNTAILVAGGLFAAGVMTAVIEPVTPQSQTPISPPPATATKEVPTFTPTKTPTRVPSTSTPAKAPETSTPVKTATKPAATTPTAKPAIQPTLEVPTPLPGLRPPR